MTVTVDLAAVHLALYNRVKPALPAYRELENVAFDPPATAAYVSEDFVPTGGDLHTFPAQGGTVLDDGIYVLRWYGERNAGTKAMNAGIQAVLDLVPVGYAITATGGTVVRIGTRLPPNRTPWRGKIQTDPSNGRPVATITIPWWTQTTQSF